MDYSMKPQKNRISTVNITDQGSMSTLIRSANPDHDQLISSGYRLTASSRLWVRRDERFTLRLVYRKDKASKEYEFTKISHVIRG